VGVVAAAVFLGALDGDLLTFDDDVFITNNPLIKDFRWSALPRLLTRRQLGMYNPLPLLVFSAEYALWGERPTGYHAVNVALHGLNAGLVFAFAWVLARRRFVAFGVALLWAVHPVRVEAVAWASQLKEVLGTFCFLLALLLYLTRGRGRSALWLAGAMFVLALACKPIYATLPAVLLLCELYRERQVGRRAFLHVLPFFAIAALWSVLAVTVTREAAGSILPRPPAERIATSGYLFGFYPRKTLWPGVQTVTYRVPRLGLNSPEFLLSVLGAAAVLATCAAAFRRVPLLVFGAAFYTITILPMLCLVPYPGAICADRFSYLPGIGLAILVAAGLAALFRAGRVRTLPAYGLVVALAAPAAVTAASRTEAWDSDLRLWRADLRAEPDSYFVRNQVGCAYRAQGRLEAARRQLAIAVHLAPDEFQPRANLGAVCYDRKEYGDAARWYRSALDRAGRNERLRGYLVASLALHGKQLRATGRPGAAAAYEEALGLEPGLFFAHFALADLYAEQPGGRKRAIRHYRLGLEQAPAGFPESDRIRAKLEALESGEKPGSPRASPAPGRAMPGPSGR
jgi:tetratricopeptide (TPR) repeat protein